MAGFNADGIVEPLDYDLTKYVDGAKGTIREPTTLQVQTFQTATALEAERYRQELTPAEGEDITGADVLAYLEKMSPERVKAQLKRQADIYAALCSGQPSAAQLGKLPHRVMIAFARWLSDELINPEARAGGGSVTPIRSRAAG